MEGGFTLIFILVNCDSWLHVCRVSYILKTSLGTCYIGQTRTTDTRHTHKGNGMLKNSVICEEFTNWTLFNAAEFLCYWRCICSLDMGRMLQRDTCVSGIARRTCFSCASGRAGGGKRPPTEGTLPVPAPVTGTGNPPVPWYHQHAVGRSGNRMSGVQMFVSTYTIDSCFQCRPYNCSCFKY